MATPIKWGSEFLVNTTTYHYQYHPRMVGLADGRFIAVWTDYSGSGTDTSGFAIRAQVFAADGTKLGGEIDVNTTTENDQWAPAVLALANGGFVVSWTDYSQTAPDTSGYAIRAQMFGPDGVPVGSEFLVNTTTNVSQREPDMTALVDGGFVITFTDDSQTDPDTSSAAVRAQIYNADGTPRGGEFVVNTTAYHDQSLPAATGLLDGRFVVTWSDYSQSGGDTSHYAVHAQVFNADGTLSGSQFLVNTTKTSNQFYSDATALSDGGFVIAFIDDSGNAPDTSGSAIRAQIFNADGTPRGGEFVVNTTTAQYQENPALAALDDGRFVVTWEDASSTGGDTSDKAIRAQVFNADGSLSGSEFLVNSTTLGRQGDPDITALADGRFVVTYTDESRSPDDPSYSAVRAQIFDPRDAPVLTDLDGDSLAYAEGDGAVVVDQPPDAVVSDANDSPDFDTGTLTVSIVSGGDTAEDLLGIRNQGTGTGEIGVAGSDVSFEGTVIGTFAGGSGGADLVVTLNANATVAAAGALVRNVTYENTDTDAPTQSDRTIRFNLTDGDGGTSGDQDVTVAVSNVNDAPTGGVAITGTAQVGQTLTLDMSTLDDDDGLPLSGFDYTWSLDGTPIAGATGTSLLLEGGHAGGTVTVAVGYTDGEGTVETVLSDPTGIVGNAPIIGNKRSNKLVGDAAPDTLIGKGGNDTLKGMQGDDVLKGGTGKDKLLSHAGDDLLQGHGGKDKLYGGTGDDILTGGNQVDTFFFRTGWGTDTITDFDAKGRVHDVLDLSRLGEVKSWNDLRKHHLAQDGDDVVIDAGNGDLIVLEDVLLKHLDKGDFHF